MTFSTKILSSDKDLHTSAPYKSVSDPPNNGVAQCVSPPRYGLDTGGFGRRPRLRRGRPRRRKSEETGENRGKNRFADAVRSRGRQPVLGGAGAWLGQCVQCSLCVCDVARVCGAGWCGAAGRKIFGVRVWTLSVSQPPYTPPARAFHPLLTKPIYTAHS